MGLKLDAYYVEYFANPFHFAGHYVAIYGYDDEHAYLVDTRQQGGNVKISLASLALARAEKGPMSSKNLYYTIAGNMENVELKEVLIAAMVKNAKQYLAPPISNFQNPCHKREKCNGNIGFIRIGHLNEKIFCSKRFNRFSLKINNKLNLKRVYIQFVINYIDLICEIEINLALYCSVYFGVTLYQECLRACSPALCRWHLRFQNGRL